MTLRTSAAAAILLVTPLSAHAQFTAPAWAFPAISPEIAQAPPYDSVKFRRVPLSARTFTQAQVKDFFAPPDWHPASHPAMPEVVARGRKPTVFACGYCHLPDGQGRAENAVLAGLPVDYFIRQVADIKAGTRREAVSNWGPSVRMHDVALAVSDSDVAEAARYFAAIRAKPRYRVVEKARIPVTYEAGGLYSVRPGTATELLGARIIEITDDLARHELRDARTTFTAYVPPGSIGRGRRLATTATPPLTSCTTCHGPALRGLGDIPPLAGRSPSYLLRQLVAFRTGARAAVMSAPMQAVVAGLSLDDMIAVVAYAGSLKP